MHEEKVIRDVVDYFYAHSIQEYIKLPEIAVMGETYSGKSSFCQLFPTFNYLQAIS
jgi:GTP-binding protein EngB required for normal cell division